MPLGDLLARSSTLRRAVFRSHLLRKPLTWFRHVGLNADDVLIVSYPRSGTTWLRFILGEALTGRSAEFDPRDHPVPYIGDQRRAPRIVGGTGRLLYSHEVLPIRQPKVVYIARDPRSVAMSEYRWLLRRGLVDEDIDRFLLRFVRGTSNPWGPWDAHVERWLSSSPASRDRLHIVLFEQLRADALPACRDITRFIGVPLDDESLQRAIDGNRLENMRAKEDRAPDRAFAKGVERQVRFVGAGSVSAWSERLTRDQVHVIETAFAGTMRRLSYHPSDDPNPT